MSSVLPSETLPSTSSSNSSESNGSVVLQCTECSYKSSRSYNFKRHIETKHDGKTATHHDGKTSTQSGNSICLEEGCSFRCLRIHDLREHLMRCHDITFKVENIYHNCFQDFERWKANIELEELCSFVKQTGHKERGVDGPKVQYFHCNRSGVNKRKGKGDRSSKSQGSCKIDMNCTSSMVVTINNDGATTTEICFTHYGHKKELQHVWISEEVRSQVAAKLQQGVSYERILDDIRDNVSSTITRDHLITKKDITNIEISFGLNDIQRHPNDHISVCAWISEYESLGDDNPILFVKMQGDEAPEGLDLASEDFMLIIQNPLQKSMLQKFGANGVCIDSTHGTNGYDFPLITLLVIDEFGEGFPVAWCLSNHEDFTIMCIMFTKIRENCGNIPAAWIMSDLAQQYYNAWVAVMDDPRPQKLMCTWHVDKAWRDELRKKVGNFELEAETYKKLRTVLEELDEVAFEKYLDLLINFFHCNPELERFGTYFVQYWPVRKKEWAFVYRKESGINTNMFVESFHRVFKYNYLKGKTNKRLDSCIVALVKFARDKGFERILKCTKGKKSHRVAVIKERHDKSIDIPFQSLKELNGQKFEVESEDSGQIYVVQKLQDGCCCQICCKECAICVHTFTCTCPDSLATTSICKHVHLVRRWQASTKENAECSSKAVFVNDVQNQDIELNFISPQATCNKQTDLAKLKHQIEGKLLTLMSGIKENNDMLILQELDKQLSASHNLLKATAFSSVTNATLVESGEWKKIKNTNIERQRKFHSTKRKRQKSKVRYGRPTHQDKERIIEMMEKSSQECLLAGDPNVLKWLAILTSEPVMNKVLTDEYQKIDASQLMITDGCQLPGEMLEVALPEMAKVLFEPDAWAIVFKAIEQLNQEWTCSLCKETSYVNMIECVGCGQWIDWRCANISAEMEEEWFCPQCENSCITIPQDQ